MSVSLLKDANAKARSRDRLFGSNVTEETCPASGVQVTYLSSKKMRYDTVQPKRPERTA